jgi:hypothetical protein
MLRMIGIRTFAFALLAVATLLPALAGDEPDSQWRSPLLTKELVLIDVAARDEGEPAELPTAVRAKTSNPLVEYARFVATRLSTVAAADLRTEALAADMSVSDPLPRPPVELPFHSFDPAADGVRFGAWPAEGHTPQLVPGLYLVRFGYPVVDDEDDDWLKDLDACDVQPILYLGNSTYLTHAADLDTITSCDVAAMLEWAGPFLTTDRVSVETLQEATVLGQGYYELQFLPETTSAAAIEQLPEEVKLVEAVHVIPGGPLGLVVKADRAALDGLVDNSPDLLTILPWSAGGPSDERQGHIVARIVDSNGIPISPTGTPPQPHYDSWLTTRGLNTSTNQQTIAVFDTGYDDGTGTSGDHHPELELPERLVAIKNLVPDEVGLPSGNLVADTRGHGTLVAGIIAGKRQALDGSVDSDGFYRGEGIAPLSKLVALKIFSSGPSPGCLIDNEAIQGTSSLAAGFNFARLNGTQDRALIANHSWNGTTSVYDDRAQLFDQRVIDAYDADPALQPMTVVVAAANAGSANNTVRTPATAKNVITVGSTQGYRPNASDPPQACDNGGSTHPTTNPALVSSFSSRGPNFGPATGADVRTTRVKPDLVAPGGQVTSIVPYFNEGTTGDTYRCALLCKKYYPPASLPAPPYPGSYYSYGEGTSFAAPVVSGAAGLARKWLIEHHSVASPSPSLIKAALIATADDLDNGGDHRPSNDQGWGRLNIERLTDSTPKLVVDESVGKKVATGEIVEIVRSVADPTKPTFVVLVWSDPANSVLSGDTNFPLVNDLNLRVRSGSHFRYGNVFQENIANVDNGYSYLFDNKALPTPDTRNNVEAVFIAANTAFAGEQLTLEVRGANVPMGPTQSWSLYAYNLNPAP